MFRNLIFLSICLTLSVYALDDSVDKEKVDKFVVGSRVIELNPEDLWRLDEGEWLVQVYAKWCGFCQQLSPVWDGVANQLFKKVNVAKIDGSDNLDVSFRFQVNAYPTIFHVKNGSVRIYEGQRQHDDFMKFVKEGYKSLEPLSFLSSPVSLAGKFYGIVGKLTVHLVKLQEHLQESYEVGTNIFIGGLIVTVLASLGLIMFVIGFIYAFFTRHTPSASKPRSTKTSMTSNQNATKNVSKSEKKQEPKKVQAQPQEQHSDTKKETSGGASKRKARKAT